MLAKFLQNIHVKFIWPVRDFFLNNVIRARVFSLYHDTSLSVGALKELDLNFMVTISHYSY